jgi:hypothetical protein
MKQRFEHSGKSVARTALAALAVAALCASCPSSLLDFDMRGKIAEDVREARAPMRRVTIEAVTGGVASPSGSFEVKDGKAFDLSVSAFATHGFLRWEKASGAGTLIFDRPDSPATSATLSGGDAVIRAVLGERPRVLYTSPIGSGIPINSSASIVFSEPIDPESVDPSTIRLLLDGYSPVECAINLSPDGRVVKLKPFATLAPYRTFVIAISAQLRDLSGLSLAGDQTEAFKTSNALDQEPPYNCSFAIQGGAYTMTRDIILVGISAVDDSGDIPFILVKNAADAAWTADIPYQSSHPWTLADQDGRQEVWMRFQDSIGNVTAETDYISHSIILDRQAPNGAVLAAGGNAFTSSPTITLDLGAADPNSGAQLGSGESEDGIETAADPDSLKQVMISNAADFAGAYWEGYAPSRPGWALDQASVDGTKTVYVRFRDAVGNVSADYSDTIILDRSAPSGSAALLSGGLATNSLDISLSLDFSDGPVGSGVASMRVRDDSDIASASAWSTGDPASPLQSLTENGAGGTDWFNYDTRLNGSLAAGIDGPRTITLELKDAVGNVSDHDISIALDTSPPTAQATALAIAEGAAVSSPTVTLSIASAQIADASPSSGIAWMAFANTDDFSSAAWVPFAPSYTWTLDSPTVEGAKTVYARFRDAAGNESASVSAITNLDMSPDAGQIVLEGGSAYTNTASIDAEVNAGTNADMRFRVDEGEWSAWEAPASSITTRTFTLAGEGLHTVYAEFRDNAMNIAQDSKTITLDSVVPVLSSVLIRGSGDGSDTYIKTLETTLESSASDTGTGIQQMRISFDGSAWGSWINYSSNYKDLILGGTGETRAVWLQLRDYAGNESNVLSDTIIYDNVDPSAGSVSLNGGAAWTNNPLVTVANSASDSLSGLYQVQYSNDGTTWSAWEGYASVKSSFELASPTVEAAAKPVHVRVRDRAGNVSAPSSATIGLDLTAPVLTSISLNAGATTTPSLHANLSLTATDSGGSGLAQVREFHESVYSNWETYAASKLTTLAFSVSAGTKTYWAQVKDSAGNESNWKSDTISLTVASPYAQKGGSLSSGSTGTVVVYFDALPVPSGTNVYSLWYNTTGADPNSGGAVTQLTGYVSPALSYTHSVTTATKYYYFVMASNSSTGGDGPYSPATLGYSSNVTIVYNASDHVDASRAQDIKRLLTEYGESMPTGVTGIMPSFKVTLLPESEIAALIDDTNVYKYRIYADPLFITDGTTLYQSQERVNNVFAHGHGVFAMGHGGAQALNVAAVRWATWGFSGQAPGQIGFSQSVYRSTSNTQGYVWTTESVNYWNKPLSSTDIPGHQEIVSLGTAACATERYSIYASGGTPPTGGYLECKDYGFRDYFTVAAQGRCLFYGYRGILDGPTTGMPFFINLTFRQGKLF